jgi:hypothetical protein
MSANPRDNYRAKHGKKKNGPPFVQLYYHMVDSAAWHELSLVARAAYVEVARLYDGLNNGSLAMSARRLAELVPCNKDTAARALTELENAGFLAVMKVGSFTRKERHSSEYRLTCYRCDVTGQPPSKEFDPSKKWKQTRSEKSGQIGPKKPDRCSQKRESVRRNRTVKAILTPVLGPTKPDTYRLSTIGDSTSAGGAKHLAQKRSERVPSSHPPEIRLAAENPSPLCR